VIKTKSKKTNHSLKRNYLLFVSGIFISFPLSFAVVPPRHRGYSSNLLGADERDSDSQRKGDLNPDEKRRSPPRKAPQRGREALSTHPAILSCVFYCKMLRKDGGGAVEILKGPGEEEKRSRTHRQERTNEKERIHITLEDETVCFGLWFLLCFLVEVFAVVFISLRPEAKVDSTA